ncbi:MAG: FecR family protein [Opitutaceae bacterium]
MNNPGRSFDAIESRAAAWLTRRDAGMSAAEQAEFERWCAAHPRHAAAVSEIEVAWAAFDRPSAAGQTESLRAELRALARRDRQRWVAAGAASALAAACLAVFFSLQRPTARVIEPERQTLPDGSVVELNRGAEITVAFGGHARVVILKSGEAHFSVIRNPQQPFIVEAGTVKIRAVGTAFAVQLGRAEVEVLVTEGIVSVAALPPASAVGSGSLRGTPPSAGDFGAPPLVEAGQRAIVPREAAGSRPEVVSMPMAELSERLSWRRPRLDFSETSVAEAIILFSRHNQVQLRAADDAVAAMRITGVFRSDNIEGFVRALESSLDIRADHRDGEIVLRRAQ